MKKRILFISNLYPNALYPNMASFNRQQIAALGEIAEVEIIAPIPWTSRIKQSLNLEERVENGLVVHHPIYYFTPRVFRELYGAFYYYSIKRVANDLLGKKHFDIIYSSWLFPDSWAAAKLAKQYDIPLIVKVHGTDVNRLIAGTDIANKSMEVVKSADKVVCVSKALKEKLKQLGAPENKLEVLYNGVDRSIFFMMNKQETRQRFELNSEEFVVLFVGNLIKEKGLEELITAFKVLIDKKDFTARLIIIGSGIYTARAKQLASSFNIDRFVQFLGNQPQEIISCWMNAASVLCLPSYMEGIPNVVLEALSCGTQVVASDVGGIPELDNQDGMLKLIPPRNSKMLANVLMSIATDSSYQIRTRSILSWHENVAQLYKIFQSVINKKINMFDDLKEYI